MPGKNAHIIGSLIIGLLTGFLLFSNFFYSIIFGLLSTLTATLPDRIEPPTNKFHRGFFHSVTLLLILIVLLYYLINNPLSGIIYGYVIHLLLDYSLGRHIPIM